MEVTPGTLVGGRFRLLHPLGEGGMGRVWYAEHALLGTACAVKIIHEELARNEGVRARFEREAKVVASLRSPHVVTVLDYGVCSGLPYIAMEYLEGEDLGHRLARRQRLCIGETIALVAQIARALAKAHGMGLVHRDLKPENVFLVRDGHRDFVKVLDFGVAKVAQSFDRGSAYTRAGQLLGTPWYMSPEQAQGLTSVDWRSDLWALAVIAYRCLVGKVPFDGRGVGDVLVNIVAQPLPIPSRHAPELPVAFDAWWLRAVARDRGARFQSATALSEALSQVFARLPAEALADPIEDETTIERLGAIRLPTPPSDLRAAEEPGEATAVAPADEQGPDAQGRAARLPVRPTLPPVARAARDSDVRWNPSRVLGVVVGGGLAGALLVLGGYSAYRAATDIGEVASAPATEAPPAPADTPMEMDAAGSARFLPVPAITSAAPSEPVVEPVGSAPPMDPAPAPSNARERTPPPRVSASASASARPPILRNPFE